ncbi:hypothetical protein BVX97_05345 [bacterium E08(2017)]|nr:hypothetical protein BVX97_05345 [bacterium E08(2017)]
MRTIRATLLPLFIFILTLGITSAEAKSPKDSYEIMKKTGEAFTAVAEKATPAVVFIRVEKVIKSGGGQFEQNNPFDIFGDDFFRKYFGGGHGYNRGMHPRMFKQRAAGSGFLISDDGYILTNNHVVGDADKITVVLNNGEEYEAEIVGTDPKSEVAVIKIDGKNLPYLEFGDSEKLNVGEWVIAIGNPFEFFTGSVTVGVVSAKGRSNLHLMEDVEYQDFIQTDAAINPGNSGGPLLDIDGKVVGINTAIVSNTGGFMGLGFAIPINLASSIKDQLISSGKVVRGHLGISIQLVTQQLADAFDLKKAQGILIAQVMPDSAAEKAGLRNEDIIIKLNGEEVKSIQSFKNEVASNPPGTKISLTVIRNGKEKTIKAETGSRDDYASATFTVFDKLGIGVEEITNKLANRFGLRDSDGVIVSSVENDSPAARAYIAPGYIIKAVNRRPVSTIQEFKEALQLSEESGAVLLLIRNENHAYYVTISLDD